jgi:hypothetical protein
MRRFCNVPEDILTIFRTSDDFSHCVAVLVCQPFLLFQHITEIYWSLFGNGLVVE